MTDQRPASLPGLFVTGTDTGVGKTVVASAIARVLTRDGRRVGVLKPVATGVIDGVCEDAEALMDAVGGGVPRERVTPIVFEAPLAPPVAARRAGTRLEWRDLLDSVGLALDWWSARAEVMVVEGVGGWLCPLAEGNKAVADLAIALDYPLVIVARGGLGTLNHTLLTVESARGRGLRIAGVVLNDPEPAADSEANATNPVELARRLDGVAILGIVRHGEDAATTLGGTDWHGWAHSSRMEIEPSRSSGPEAPGA
jgi:dethiobiotin synthetase